MMCILNCQNFHDHPHLGIWPTLLKTSCSAADVITHRDFLKFTELWCTAGRMQNGCMMTLKILEGSIKLNQSNENLCTGLLRQLSLTTRHMPFVVTAVSCYN
jgi:hypothetical protein